MFIRPTPTYQFMPHTTGILLDDPEGESRLLASIRGGVPGLCLYAEDDGDADGG